MRFETVFGTLFPTLYRFLRSSNTLFHIVSIILISFDSVSCVESNTFPFWIKNSFWPSNVETVSKSKVTYRRSMAPTDGFIHKNSWCRLTPQSLQLSIFIWCTGDISRSFKLSWRYENISLYDLCFGPAKDLFFLVCMQHVACCVGTTSHVNKNASSKLSLVPAVCYAWKFSERLWL